MPDAPSSDDEAESDFAGNALDGDAAKTAAAANRAKKDEREENLRRMMDDDAEGLSLSSTPFMTSLSPSLPSLFSAYIPSTPWLPNTATDEIHAEEPPAPTEDATAIDIDEPDPAAEPEPEPAPTTTVSNGRRRGRRRVMKKKTTKDAEGYLVTKEEMGWESFSESDRESEVKKAAAPSVSKDTAKTKTGAGGAGGAGGAAKKKGQGNIMSFFGKK